MENPLIIHTDGGARGNPGPAAIGVVIELDNRTLSEISRAIGSTTNNQAEYQAVHAALKYAVDNNYRQVVLYSDSELIVNQLNGKYKVKNKDLGEWYIRCRGLMDRIGSIKLVAVPREQNKKADALVNLALDHAAG